MQENSDFHLKKIDQNIRNKLKTVLEDPEFCMFELTDFCVANTKGRFLISKNSNSLFQILRK